MNNMLQQFQQFVANFQKQRKNPQQVVQELLNSGKMSQQQFQQLAQQADKLMGKKMF